MSLEMGDLFANQVLNKDFLRARHTYLDIKDLLDKSNQVYLDPAFLPTSPEQDDDSGSVDNGYCGTPRKRKKRKRKKRKRNKRKRNKRKSDDCRSVDNGYCGTPSPENKRKKRESVIASEVITDRLEASAVIEEPRVQGPFVTQRGDICYNIKRKNADHDLSFEEGDIVGFFL